MYNVIKKNFTNLKKQTFTLIKDAVSSSVEITNSQYCIFKKINMKFFLNVKLRYCKIETTLNGYFLRTENPIETNNILF